MSKASPNYRKHSLDHAGEVYGKVTLISFVGRSKGGSQKWMGACECGTTKEFWLPNLRAGNTVSCGCVQRSQAGKDGAVDRGGESKTPEYACWQTMNWRCSDKATGRVRANYFDRGIRVCPEWSDWETGYEAFLRDMGRVPPGLTLDRTDNDGPYSKSNCRWVSMKVQANNKRLRQRDMPEPGTVFGHFTLLSFAGIGSAGQRWLTRCVCGDERVRFLSPVRCRPNASCGCRVVRHSKPPLPEPEPGDIHGYFILVGYLKSKDYKQIWKCVCSGCGQMAHRRLTDVRTGRATHCGCMGRIRRKKSAA